MTDNLSPFYKPTPKLVTSSVDDKLFEHDNQATLDAARSHVLATLLQDPITSLIMRMASGIRFLWIRYRLKKLPEDATQRFNFLNSAANNTYLLNHAETLRRYLDELNQLESKTTLAQVLVRNPALLRAALLYHNTTAAMFAPLQGIDDSEELQQQRRVFAESAMRDAEIHAILSHFNITGLPPFVRKVSYPSQQRFGFSVVAILFSALASGGVLGAAIGFLVAGLLGALIGGGSGALAVMAFAAAYKALRNYLINRTAAKQTIDDVSRTVERKWYLGSTHDRPLHLRFALGVAPGALIGAAWGSLIPGFGTALGALIGGATMGVAAMVSNWVVAKVVAKAPAQPSKEPVARHWYNASIQEEPWYQRQFFAVVACSILGAALAGFFALQIGGWALVASAIVLGVAIGASVGAVLSWMFPMIEAFVTHHLSSSETLIPMLILLTSVVLVMGSVAALFIVPALFAPTSIFGLPLVFALLLSVIASAVAMVLSRTDTEAGLMRVSAKFDLSVFQRLAVGAVLGLLLGLAINFLVPVATVISGFFIGPLLGSIVSVLSPIALYRSDTGISLSNPLLARLAVCAVWGLLIGAGVALAIAVITTGAWVLPALSSVSFCGAIGVLASVGCGLIMGDALPAPATLVALDNKPKPAVLARNPDQENAIRALLFDRGLENVSRHGSMRFINLADGQPKAEAPPNYLEQLRRQAATVRFDESDYWAKQQVKAVTGFSSLPGAAK